MDSIPLALRYSGLLGLARIPLCELPTPIEPLPELARILDIPNLYIKRDDLSCSTYGGNKIRKLEFLLAEAQRRQAKQVLTFGYTGSNFALATAINAEQLGMRCISMLLPQHIEPYVKTNLLLSHQYGAELHLGKSETVLAAKTLARTAEGAFSADGKPFWISAGGSDPLGVIGFVNAAFELAQQLEENGQATPDFIYVPCGSMGTTVGLAIGCAALGWTTNIISTRVVEEKHANLKAMLGLAKKTIKLLKQHDATFPNLGLEQLRINLRQDQMGEEYGHVTEACQYALNLSEADGLKLDGTYSGKALASLVVDAPMLKDKHVLFWNTHNSIELDPLITNHDHSVLPKAFHPIFTGHST